MYGFIWIKVHIYVDEDFVDLLDFSYITCELSRMDMISDLLKSSNKLSRKRDIAPYCIYPRLHEQSIACLIHGIS